MTFTYNLGFSSLASRCELAPSACTPAGAAGVRARGLQPAACLSEQHVKQHVVGNMTYAHRAVRSTDDGGVLLLSGFRVYTAIDRPHSHSELYPGAWLERACLRPLYNQTVSN